MRNLHFKNYRGKLFPDYSIELSNQLVYLCINVFIFVLIIYIYLSSIYFLSMYLSTYTYPFIYHSCLHAYLWCHGWQNTVFMHLAMDEHSLHCGPCARTISSPWELVARKILYHKYFGIGCQQLCFNKYSQVILKNNKFWEPLPYKKETFIRVCLGLKTL